MHLRLRIHDQAQGPISEEQIHLPAREGGEEMVEVRERAVLLEEDLGVRDEDYGTQQMPFKISWYCWETP